MKVQVNLISSRLEQCYFVPPHVIYYYFSLDIFGYLTVQGIGANFGLTDQIEALKWVQENIVKFGGDPNKVRYNNIINQYSVVED